MKRKIICILCAMLSFTLLNTNIVNAEDETTIHTEKIESSDSVFRYTEIYANNPTLSISNRTARATASINLLGKYRCIIRTTLQRSTNQSSWTDVITWEENGQWSGLTSFSYDYTTAVNLYYQVKCTIEVYNTNNTLLESNTEYSNIVCCT